MTNARQKGKRIERWFANKMENIFPNIRRNAGTQAQSGGVDLEQTPGYNFECKGGKKYTLESVQDAINQVKKEGKDGYFDIVLVKPNSGRWHKKDPYAIIQFKHLKQLIAKIKDLEEMVGNEQGC